MIKLMDRQMIYGYFKLYFVCLASLVSLWVVVDLFTNLDDFTHHHKTFLGVLQHISAYYGFRLTKIFDQLCEPIVLMAAMFTVAWMQRCNEQYPLLSAGISTKRIVAPLLLCALFTLTLTVVNVEYVIPGVADRLAFDKDDPGGDKEMNIQGVCYEPNGIHIGGEKANRRKQTVTNFECLIPDSLAGDMKFITADEAVYVPGTGPLQGGWLPTNAKPSTLDTLGDGSALYRNRLRPLFPIHPNRQFRFADAQPQLVPAGLDGAAVRGTAEAGIGRQAGMAVLFHMRLTRPILGFLLVVMGLGVILRDQNRNVIISAGMCLVLCAVFFAAVYACRCSATRRCCRLRGGVGAGTGVRAVCPGAVRRGSYLMARPHFPPPPPPVTPGRGERA